MTEVTYRHQGDKHLLTAVGHSEYAEPGKDIVCSSVSTIIYMAGLMLEKVDEESSCHMEEGYAEITAQSNEKTDFIMESTMECFGKLQDEYPKNIMVVFERE